MFRQTVVIPMGHWFKNIFLFFLYRKMGKENNKRLKKRAKRFAIPLDILMIWEF